VSAARDALRTALGILNDAPRQSAREMGLHLMPRSAVSPPANARGSIVALDLLRAVAALIVFFGHIRGGSFVEFGALPPEHKGALAVVLFGITRLSHEAVMVFFALSGFLVGGQIIRHLRAGRFGIVSYSIERSSRILLPLIPACLLTVAVGWLVFDRRPDWAQVLLNMVGLNGVLVDTLMGNLPLWTLTYEIWFYTLAGAVGYLVGSRRPSPLAFLIIVGGACVFSMLATRYLLFWCAGALSVLLLGAPRRRALALMGTLFFFIGVAGYQLGVESKSFVNVTCLPKPIAEAFICIGTSLTIPFLCEPATNAAISILRKPALYLSSVSYTLYLVH